MSSPIENEMPLLVESCELRTDGGGPGNFRGGAGMIRRVRLMDQEAQYSVLSDRGVIPPWGVSSAGSGLPYHLSIERNGEIIEFDTPGKVTGYPIFRDDVLVMRSSGGGGYGDPLLRDPERVRRDVVHGVVSTQAAREWYGVALTSDGFIDETATEHLRAECARSRFTARIVADDELDAYAGAKGRHRIVRLAAADAEALGVADNDLVEMFARNPAPLRAWVCIDENLARTGEIRLDAFGRRVLGIADGDRIMVRSVSTPVVRAGMARGAR